MMIPLSTASCIVVSKSALLLSSIVALYFMLTDFAHVAALLTGEVNASGTVWNMMPLVPTTPRVGSSAAVLDRFARTIGMPGWVMSLMSVNPPLKPTLSGLALRSENRSNAAYWALFSKPKRPMSPVVSQIASGVMVPPVNPVSWNIFRVAWVGVRALRIEAPFSPMVRT